MRVALLFFCILLSSSFLQAADIRVAVAANFRDTLIELAHAYEAHSGNKLLISGGPTGALYNQIIHGAPFDLFFAADTRRPELLVEADLVAPDSYRVYALGQLVLWDPQQQVLEPAGLADYKGRLAIASPEVAPYGAAALEVLDHLSLSEGQQPFKLVRGNSIAHAYQYVHTGNAAVGFVAASQVLGKEGVYPLAQELYSPLSQALVQLKNSKNAAASSAFLAWLEGDEASAIIRKYGYALPD